MAAAPGPLVDELRSGKKGGASLYGDLQIGSYHNSGPWGGNLIC